MSSHLKTFVKTRTAEAKILHLLVFLGLLGGGRLLYDLAKLALLEIPRLLP